MVCWFERHLMSTVKSGSWSKVENLLWFWWPCESDYTVLEVVARWMNVSLIFVFSHHSSVLFQSQLVSESVKAILIIVFLPTDACNVSAISLSKDWTNTFRPQMLALQLYCWYVWQISCLFLYWRIKELQKIKTKENLHDVCLTKTLIWFCKLFFPPNLVLSLLNRLWTTCRPHLDCLSKEMEIMKTCCRSSIRP